MSKPNAILSAIFDPGSIDLNPFLGSLKKTGFDGDVVFFVTWATPAQLDGLRKLGARVETFRYFYYRKNNPLTFLWPLWKFLFRVLPSLGPKKRIAQYVFNMMCVRFVVYHDFLEKHGHEYSNVLLTDARDVYFQDNPFRDFNEPGVCFFLEDTRHTLGTNAANRKMIEMTYGRNIVEQIAGKPISCAGTTMGQAPAILDYLNRMLRHLFEALWMHRVCINDQGVHNYLAHVEMKDLSRRFENEHGRVHTMGLCQPEDFHFDAEGRLINADGSVIPILHQYDRFKEITARLLKNIRL